MNVAEGETPDLAQALRQQYDLLAKSQSKKFPVRASALGDCPRKLASLIRKVESDVPTERSMRIFEIGDQRGRALAQAAISAISEPHHALLEYEVHIPTWLGGDVAALVLRRADAEWEDHGLTIDGNGRLRIRGRLDLAIFHGSGPLVDVVDFKTTSDYGFKQLGSSAADMRYTVQVLGYGRGLEELGFKVNSYQLLYENKNTCELKAVDVPATPENLALLDEKIAVAGDILVSWARGTAFDEAASAVYAEGVQGYLPWQCNYCSVGPIRGRCTGGMEVVDSPTSKGGPHRWIVR